MATKLERLEKKLIDGGVDPAKAAALVASANDETIASVLETLAKRDDDYSAQLGRVRSLETEKQKLEKVKEDYDKWYYEVALPAAQRNAAIASGQQPQPQPNPQPAIPALTLDDVQRLMAQSSQNFAGVIKDVGTIASQHAALYHEPLDMDEIEKIAVEHKIGVRDAYKRYIEPRENARQKAEIEARIAKAKEEAVQEYASKHNLPADPAPDQFNYVNKHNIPASDKLKSEADINQELLSIWNTEGRKAALAR